MTRFAAAAADGALPLVKTFDVVDFLFKILRDKPN